MRRPSWFARKTHDDAELDDEIRAHLAERADECIAKGLAPAEAMAAAKRAFGNVSVVTERSRDVWRWTWLEAVRMDTLYALRLIKRYPAFSVNVILISAVGIAACTSTFSLINGVLLAPLPFAKSAQVFSLNLQSAEGQTSAALPAQLYHQIAAGSPVIEDIGAAEPARALARWGAEPMELRSIRATPSFLRVFQSASVRGRFFTEGDVRERLPVVVLSNALWRARFKSDTAALGTTLVLDSVAHTVVGIMPPSFRAHFQSEPDIWLPLHVPDDAGANGLVNAEVLLRDGVTAEAAERWLGAALRVRMESSNQRDSVSARPVMAPIHETIYGDVAQPLRILFAAVMLVLLLICANVATMFLARSSNRDHELMVRRALGASSARQLAQLITESVVLVGTGGVLGTMASIWFISALRELGATVLPRLDVVSLNGNVVVFAALATLCTGIFGGLPPALAARRDLRSPNAGARVTGRRTSSLLVIAQVSFSMILLVGSGLLLKSFVRLMPSSPGFALANRTALFTSMRGVRLPTQADSNQTRHFVELASERLLSVPGVRDVAAMSFIPFTGMVASAQVRLIGKSNPDKPFSAFQNVVTPNLLTVLNIPIRRGRGFTQSDQFGTEQVAIVNEAAVARWWNGENAVGKRIAVKSLGQERTVTVIGVMANARMFGHNTKLYPEIYRPIAQVNAKFAAFIVQTDGRPPTRLLDLQRAIWSIAPDLPLGTSGDLGSYASESVRRPRFFAWAMGAFAMVAVTLSAAAVYGLLTLDVVQRRQEIGVRMALGATASGIGGLVLKRASLLAVSGVVVGIVAARAVSQYMESLLVEVSANDASVFAGTAAIALLLACLAACAPAYRAVRVDPARSLRGEG